MSVAFDEYGHPFIIIKDQPKQSRLTGLGFHRRCFTNTLQKPKKPIFLQLTQLQDYSGPLGMDKIIVSPDGDVLVTNDGATILEKMDIQSPLIVELSKSQDDEIGDGTTGVVILAGALLEEAEKLLRIGIHPIRICNGFEKAAQLCTTILEEISVPILFDEKNLDPLYRIAKTAISSKIVNRFGDQFAKIAVDAVMAVADLKRKDVRLDLIKIEGKSGGKLEDTQLVKGIVLDKEISHYQMDKEFKNVKIAVLTCPFEPPKPKTKHKLEIGSAVDYLDLYKGEQQYFIDMIDTVKKSGAQLVFCQWGFDDEANHLLLKNGLNAVRWVGGVEIELIAIASGARITPRFSELSKERLGFCGSVREVSFGTVSDKAIFIEGCPYSNAVTVYVRGGSKMIVEEAKRSLHDAICVTRNLIRDNKIVYGGGAPEIHCSLKVREAANEIPSVEQYALRSFADALEQIPSALAENSGLNPLITVGDVKSQQIIEKNPQHGVDCLQRGTTNMKDQQVFESTFSKQLQVQLAAQVTKMVLKIDDVIEPKSLEFD